ncbi:hypothetical protein RJG79_04640 [Mycoplasmatota bacterium WC44]
MKNCPSCKKKTFSIWKMIWTLPYGSSTKCKECNAVIVYAKKSLFLNFVIFTNIFLILSLFGGWWFVRNELNPSLLIPVFPFLLQISIVIFTPLVKKDKINNNEDYSVLVFFGVIIMVIIAFLWNLFLNI